MILDEIARDYGDARYREGLRYARDALERVLILAEAEDPKGLATTATRREMARVLAEIKESYDEQTIAKTSLLPAPTLEDLVCEIAHEELDG